MTNILTDLSPSSLAMAIKANLYALFHSFSNSTKTGVHDNSPELRWHTAVSHPWFNGVLSSQPPVEGAVQTVGDTVAYFRSRGVADFTWWLAPSLEPTAWTQPLLAHGFRYDDHTPGMAMDLAILPPPVQHPLTIRPVENRHILAEWTRIMVRGFEMPEEMMPGFLDLIESLGTNLPFRYYLGFLNDQPVAVSTLFLGAGVAGIYNVATVAAARGQGIGSAMTLTPLYEARNMGYRAAVLQSSEMGYRIYQRLGFRKFCQVDHFYFDNFDSPAI